MSKGCIRRRGKVKILLQEAIHQKQLKQQEMKGRSSRRGHRIRGDKRSDAGELPFHNGAACKDRYQWRCYHDRGYAAWSYRCWYSYGVVWSIYGAAVPQEMRTQPPVDAMTLKVVTRLVHAAR